MIYTLAEKFLDSIDLQNIMKEIGMTRLGQMLIEKGFQDGYAESKRDTARRLLPLLDEETIAQTLELPLETIQQLKEELLVK